MKTKFNSMGRFLFTGIMLIASISLFNGCGDDDDDNGYGSGGGGGSGTQAADEVWMQSNAFNPGTRTVAVNTTVKWTNKDGSAHTVTSDNGGFTSSGNIAGGGTYSFKFTTAGTYPYHCTLHSGMNGTVVVQ